MDMNAQRTSKLPPSRTLHLLSSNHFHWQRSRERRKNAVPYTSSYLKQLQTLLGFSNRLSGLGMSSGSLRPNRLFATLRKHWARCMRKLQDEILEQHQEEMALHSRPTTRLSGLCSLEIHLRMNGNSSPWLPVCCLSASSSCAERRLQLLGT